jgi:hypothetical protein
MLVAIHKDYIMSKHRRLNSINILQGKPRMRLEEIKFKRTCDLHRSPGETKKVKWDRHLTGMQ